MIEDASLHAIKARSKQRANRMSTYHAKGHADAEAWDLQFWQDQGPEARLSALIAIHEDVDTVEKARRNL